MKTFSRVLAMGSMVVTLSACDSDSSFINLPGFSLPNSSSTVNSVVEATPTPIPTREEIFVCGGFASLNGVSDPSLAALQSDGSADSTFTVPGTSFNNYVYSLTQMDASHILAIGAYTSFNGDSNVHYISRLNLDGSLDSTFATTGTGFDNLTTQAVIDNNGKILVAGAFHNYNSNANNAMHLVRLNTDGSLDTSFALAGTGFNIQSNTLAVDSTNRVVIGGYFSNYNGTAVGGIARVNTDGSLDTTFNAGGSGFNNDPQFLLIDANGKIVVTGEFTSYNGTAVGSIVRLNTDGSLDTTFNAGGAGFNGPTWKFAIDSNGKIVVGGEFTTYNGSPAPYLARLNTDGSLDSTFSYTGTGLNADVYSVKIDASGRILAGGGFTTYNGVSNPYLIRFNSDGSLDTTFVVPGSGFNSAVYRLLLVNVPL